MLELHGLSTEAKIGKILILVSLILGIVGLLGIILGFSYRILYPFSFMRGIPLFAGFLLILTTIVKVVGLLMGYMALAATNNKNFSKAGVYAIISSLLPPFDLIMLIGGIICLISREAK
ncbi:MAG: hypothetical protein GYA60_06570 [Candidatus Methanofastidiosa archaeon]|nr:hypothetical protein [Candidatus Methanofastidiosa archaeon]